MIKKTPLYLGLLLGFAFFMPQAYSADVARDANTEVRLVSEVTDFKPGDSFWVALRFEMDPGWHVYWRNPGDSGLPPNIVWHLPPGMKASEVHWPFPKVIELDPVTTYAYEDVVGLLVRIDTDAGVVFSRRPHQASRSESSTVESVLDSRISGNDHTLKVHVDFLACEINCVPGQAKLELSLKSSLGARKTPSEWAPFFAETRTRIPAQNASWQARAKVSKKTIQLYFSNPAQVAELGEVQFFPYSDQLVDHGALQYLKKKGEGSYELKLSRSSLNSGAIEKVEGILLASRGWSGEGAPRAIEVSVQPVPDAVPWGRVSWTDLTRPHGTASGLGLVLFFAFLGGLILNLMPCVLPVLSLKILGFAEKANKDHHAPWLHGIYFAIGVVGSFFALGALLLFLRSAGESIGWGFQLQSPLFVTLLILLFFAFFLNLMGVFEIGTSLTKVGLVDEHATGVFGSIMSGVVATIVATPCTAPFMGSAIGFGLTQSSSVALLIFVFLGLGMATPYVFLTAFPPALKLVPKPGKWMLIFKRIIAIPLFLTTFWLLWILSIQRGGPTVKLVIAGLVLFAFVMKAFGDRQRGKKISENKWKVAFVLALVLIFGGVMILPSTANQGIQVKKGGIPWQTFSAEKLAELRAEGKAVFLDFTAAWCLTCKVNEKVVIEKPEVRERFEELGIVPLKADWTNKDDTISEALAHYGRNSIPLYVIYTPGSDEPELLPEILTPAILDAALDRVEKQMT